MPRSRGNSAGCICRWRPKCNILCNYCNRKFDCVNESRPGVTSSVLSPTQAIAYLERVLEAEPRITVAGIAGPGDPFANPKETLETIRLIRQRFPELFTLPGHQRPGVCRPTWMNWPSSRSPT